MKTIEEIIKVTECTEEQAEKLHDELAKLPENLREFISDNLDQVNAFNADEIEVRRRHDHSRNGANIIVKRGFSTYLVMFRLFDWLIKQMKVKVVIKAISSTETLGFWFYFFIKRTQNNSKR